MFVPALMLPTPVPHSAHLCKHDECLWLQAVASPERPRSRVGETSSAPLSPGHLLSRFLFSSCDKEKSPACSSPARSSRKHPILSCLSSKSHKQQRHVAPLSPNINTVVSFHLSLRWHCSFFVVLCVCVCVIMWNMAFHTWLYINVISAIVGKSIHWWFRLIDLIGSYSEASYDIHWSEKYTFCSLLWINVVFCDREIMSTT